MSDTKQLSDDERRLAELGYKQELHRSWSGFSNFAISFSIISILAGCFTTFGAGLEQRRSDRHLAGRGRILASFILIIGLTHVGAGVRVPDVGWHLLVGVQAGRSTGRLLHRLAQPHRARRDDRVVAYGCATSSDLTIGHLWPTSYTVGYWLTRGCSYCS